MTKQEFLRKINDIKAQNEQKKIRGFSDYNIFLTLRKDSDEVNLHSRFIHSLLNPSSNHNQGTIFLDLFMQSCSLDEFKIDINNAKVTREDHNIDILISDEVNSKYIIIENKIYAEDQSTQIQRYIKDIYKQDKKADIYVLYLTLYGKKPSDASLGKFKLDGNYLKNGKQQVKFKSISYKNDILKWLNECRVEMQNLLKFDLIISQYIDVVKNLIGTYKNTINDSLSDFLVIKENYNYFSKNKDREDFEIYKKDYEGATKQIVKNFLNDLTGKINNELKSYGVIAENIRSERINDLDLVEIYTSSTHRFWELTEGRKCILFGIYSWQHGNSQNGLYIEIINNYNMPNEDFVQKQSLIGCEIFGKSEGKRKGKFHYQKILPLTNGDIWELADIIINDDNFLNTIFDVINAYIIEHVGIVRTINKNLEDKKFAKKFVEGKITRKELEQYEQ
jgi:hypothetical protein